MNTLAILVLLSASVATAQPARARALNTEGFRLYKAGKLADAAVKFAEATAADPKYALGWYNRAATLSRIRKERGPCTGADTSRGSITGYLAKAVALDPRRRERMKKDPDLDAVRDTVAYQRLLGADPAKPKELARLVEAVTWTTESPGAFGPSFGADFQPQGKATFWELELVDGERPAKRSSQGSWRVEKTAEGLQVIVELPARGRAPALTARGKLEGDHLVLPEAKLELLDAPVECDA